MIKDADTVPKSSVLTGDICIVGAGAAGISIALALADTYPNIIVLESGKFEQDDSAKGLGKIEIDRLPVSETSRVRSFGGTTKAWYGRWKPHDAIDFEERAWVPYSGWPLSRRELEPYYEQALRFVGTPVLKTKLTLPGLFETNDLHKIQIPVLKKNDLDFGIKFKKVFESSDHIRTYVGASVTALTHAQDFVTEALVQTLSGNSFSVAARIFILASGGIENARLLLLSNIGNEHDQVGRYYMDHPKARAGRVLLANSKGLYREMSIGLTKSFQVSHRVLNSYITLEPAYTRTERLKVLPRSMRLFVHKLLKLVLGAPRQAAFMDIRNYMEQAPVPENRVTLGKAIDAFGNRLPKVSWSISEIDKNTMILLHEALESELMRTGYGKLESPLLHSPLSSWPIHEDASHHMGTTRMGNDPRTSVTDKNCKVHSVQNLYIAGSSLFPTSGYANPTATLIALALRLADHLRLPGHEEK